MVKVCKFEEDNVNSAHFCGFIRLQSTDLRHIKQNWIEHENHKQTCLCDACLKDLLKGKVWWIF